jgi:hypothetical protein
VVRSWPPRAIRCGAGKNLASWRLRVIIDDFTVQTAGVAQPVEHRFCKPRVVSSSPTASSAGWWFSACSGLPRVVRRERRFSGGYPSGQRGQTVNLVAMPSQVRILLHPCRIRLGWIGVESRLGGRNRGCNSMVEYLPSKQATWVRFPSPAFIRGGQEKKSTKAANVAAAGRVRLMRGYLKTMLPWLSW